MDTTDIPRAELAAFTRYVVEEMHDEWDGLHQFLVLVLEDGKVTPRTIGVIDPAMHPDLYPRMMAKLAKEDVDDMKAGDPFPVAYLLQIEAFGVKMPPEEDMTPEEQNDFNRDRHNRTFHNRPDAVETCMAITCDVTGRMYQVTKYRSDNSIEEEQIEPLGVSTDRQADGQMPKALRAIAYGAGVLGWGLPGPPSLAN